MDVPSAYTESSTITFEWTLKGLKILFDSTKGEKKSKVTKSMRFGNNRWQILFYANAGQTKPEGSENGGFVSLYLSCEPTPEEKELALGNSGRWVRDGVYKFSFELRNLGKNGTLSTPKEAHNHSFTWKTANWGWAQFARRDSVYHQSLPVKSQDAFVIICTITSSPATPPAYTIPRQPVPKALLETVGALLDDPLYSDIQFIIPKRGQPISKGSTIWASKKLLQRADYFQTMFNSNFAEGSIAIDDANQTPKSNSRDIRKSPPQLTLLLDEFEDSDNEFDDDSSRPEAMPIDDDTPNSSARGTGEKPILLSTDIQLDWDKVENDGNQSSDSHTSSPQIQLIPLSSDNQRSESISNISKMSIVVKDAAYTTYKAMLYYLYTDNIVFAPLSSSFIGPTSDDNTNTPLDSLPSTPSEGSQLPSSKRFSCQETLSSRTEWMKDWMGANPGRPAPCSAKSIYRIADRLDLIELKERAAQHITKSLTVENIAYEVFSPFAAAFEAIRKVEIDFFLSNWHEIRSSNTMKHVWIQIRNGRHPGFEEVWPVIIQSLEFKPNSPTITSQVDKSSEQVL